MTRDEMLSQLGIGDADFRDYLTKLADFRSSLNDAQLTFFNQTTASVATVTAAFNSDCTDSDVDGLMAEAPPIDGIACFAWGGTPTPSDPC